MEAEIARLLAEDKKSKSSIGLVLVIVVIVIALFGGLYWYVTKRDTSEAKSVNKCRLSPCSGEGWSGDLCPQRIPCPRVSDTNDIPYCPAGDNLMELQDWANGSDKSTSKGFAVSTQKACSKGDTDCLLSSRPWTHDKDIEPNGTLSSSGQNIVLSDQSDYNAISVNDYIYVQNQGFRVTAKKTNLTLSIDSETYFPLNTQFTYANYSDMKNGMCKKPLNTTGYAVSCPCDDCSSENGKSAYHPIIMPSDWDPTQAFCCPKIIQRKENGSCGECDDDNLGVVCVDNASATRMRQRICVNHGGEDKWVDMLPTTSVQRSTGNIDCWGDMCSYGYFGNGASCPDMNVQNMRLDNNKNFYIQLKKQGRDSATYKYAKQ